MIMIIVGLIIKVIFLDHLPLLINNIDTVLTTVLISGLCEGFHTITVTDDKNCSSTLHINSPEFNQ